MNGISLVMATVGRVTEVQRFIESLHSQTYRNYELIVVDQNSDKRLAVVLESARRMGVTLNHISQKEPNQCLARNDGLARAANDLIAFPDDDCWYEPTTLERVIERMGLPDAPSAVVIRWAEQDPEGHAAHLLDGTKWRSFREVDASAITQFYHRDLLASLGGFDPTLGLHSWFGGGEETDLMFRVLESGAKVAYLPDALVHHSYGLRTDYTATKLFKFARSRARGTGALYVKHSLPFWVIARGLVSPIVKSLLNIHSSKSALRQLGMFIGRLEGLVRWGRKPTPKKAV